MKIKSLPGIIILITLINITSIIALSSSTESIFFNTFSDPWCNTLTKEDPNYGIESFWVYEGAMARSMLSCYNQTGIPGPDCCPVSRSTCDRDMGDNGECVEGPEHCSEITDPDECDKGYASLAKNDLETPLILGDLKCHDVYGELYGTRCHNYLDCQCKWDENRGCEAITDHQIWYPRTNTYYNESNPDSVINAACVATGSTGNGICKFEFDIINNCDTTGVLSRGWTTNWITNQPAYCEDGADEIPCLNFVRLGFFSTTNIIIAIIVIIIIYIIIKKRKK